MDDGRRDQAVLERAQSLDPFPDADTVEAMEEPLHRLRGAAFFLSIAFGWVPIKITMY